MMYGKPLAPATQVRREAPKPVVPAVPVQMDLDNATIVINNYGPLIICAGTAENIAAVLASMTPSSPNNPHPHAPSDTTPSDTVPVEENAVTSEDVGGALPEPPEPPMTS